MQRNQQHKPDLETPHMDETDFLDWPKVSYKHENSGDEIRFVQYAKDRLPKWAVDVQAAPTDRERNVRAAL